MLVDFDHAQSAIVILVEDGLDACRFTCSRVAIEQYVVRFASGNERLRILDETLFLAFIPDEIVELHIACRRDRFQ